MPSNAEKKYFDYVKEPSKEQKSAEAQRLLDEALDGWAADNKESKSDCPWAEKGKAYVAELKKLEEAQGKSEAELKAHFDKLGELSKSLAAYEQALLKAEIEAASKGPAEKNWEKNLTYFQVHPIEGFFPMIASGLRYLWSGEMWGGKSEGNVAQEDDDDGSVESSDQAAVEGNDLYEHASLQLNLPSNAKFTSDIQTYRESTGRRHSGIDISMPEGTPLKSPGKGQVVKALTEAEKPENGNCVYVMYKIDGKVYIFCFLHMKNPSPLKKGDDVDEGTVLGEVGHTGHVIAGKGGHGDHLHFQVYDAHWHLEDPLPFLPESIGNQIAMKRDAAGQKDQLWTA